jgi:hypothetical protein
MGDKRPTPIDVLIVAIPETAGSALYGMVDVLLAAGNLWQTLVRTDAIAAPFRVRIVSTIRGSFQCGNRIPVMPDVTTADDPRADIVIVPELWVGPDEVLNGRHPELIAWIRKMHAARRSIPRAQVRCCSPRRDCSTVAMRRPIGATRTCSAHTTRKCTFVRSRTSRSPTRAAAS